LEPHPLDHIQNQFPHLANSSSHYILRHNIFICLLEGSRDENGTDIFRPYSRPNPFRGVLIRPYPSPDIYDVDIQSYPIRHFLYYPYSNPNPDINMKTNTISVISVRIRSIFIPRRQAHFSSLRDFDQPIACCILASPVNAKFCPAKLKNI
jgi:hypothetical protein